MAQRARETAGEQFITKNATSCNKKKRKNNNDSNSNSEEERGGTWRRWGLTWTAAIGRRGASAIGFPIGPAPF